MDELADWARRRAETLLPRWRADLPAMLRGVSVGLLAVTLNPVLFALSVTALALIPAAGLGLVLFPLITRAVRWRANLSRRLAAASGVPIPVPYRPDLPTDLWARFRHVVTDPATWRDLAWLVPGAVVGGVFGLLAAFLPLYGLEGILFVPIILYFAIDWYGYGVFWPMHNPVEAFLSIPQAVLFLILGLAATRWLTHAEARFASWFLRPTPAEALAERVRQLTITRADAVDAGAAELRRIERDLHDGAQARLVSLGMNIGLAEELLTRDPKAAAALLAEARESSGQALRDLRDLVRGIHPPVLAERGLEGGVRALALTVPVPVSVDVDLPGRAEAPVESAAYFAIAEALANVAKHSGASTAWVRLTHRDGRMMIQVGDNGRGAANPGAGSGLRGIGRRLAAFDGIMAVSSPPGGPTVVSMELPCALSSPRTSPSSGTA